MFKCLGEGMRSRLRILFLGCLIFSGCTSLGSMKHFHAAGGQVMDYQVDYESAFGLARDACEILNFEIRHEDYDGRTIVAKTRISWATWGERIGFYFTELGPNLTEIRIVNEAAYKVDNLFKRDWESDAHYEIRNRMLELKRAGLLKKGEA
jgi:hypothetical protein